MDMMELENAILQVEEKFAYGQKPLLKKAKPASKKLLLLLMKFHIR